MKAGIDYIGVGCGALVVNDKNEVLLLKRAETIRTEPGYWSQPGGEVEYGEKIAEAIKRELLEETGVVVEPVELLALPEVLTESTHWIAPGYYAKYVSGEPEVKEPDKHEEVRWVPIDNVPEPLTRYTRECIDAYKERFL